MQNFVPAQLGYMVKQVASAVLAAVTPHVQNQQNPHAVTAVQVGAAPASHVANMNNPHGLTLIQMVALGAVAATTLTAHTGNVSNPHVTTLAQVAPGLLAVRAGRVVCPAITTVTLGVDWGAPENYVVFVTPEVVLGTPVALAVTNKLAVSFDVALSAYAADTYIDWLAVRVA